jgi:hypothetical protein
MIMLRSPRKLLEWASAMREAKVNLKGQKKEEEEKEMMMML